MLVNVSYNNPEITRKIDVAVGRPFPLKTRWDMGGIGSPKLIIKDASLEIRNLLLLDNNINCCNIEMRPKGVIIRFRSLLETYALVIPYFKLSMYKGGMATYTVFKDHYFIKVKSDSKAIQKFFKKFMDFKAHNSPTSIEDI